MIRLGKLLLLVAAIQPAVCEDARKREDATTGSGISITATHQPRASLQAEGVDDPTLALYEVIACSNEPRKISTVRIRAEMARHGLQLVGPLLGRVTAEAKRGKIQGLADLARELAPGGAIATAFADVDPWVKGAVTGASFLIRVFVPARGRSISLADKGHLEAGPDCDSAIMLARWPSQKGGRGPEVVTVTVEVR